MPIRRRLRTHMVNSSTIEMQNGRYNNFGSRAWAVGLFP
jgi:hypothetical protein